METQAFIPHRDIILKMTKLSKKLILLYNSENFSEGRLFPVFPLWSFADDFPVDCNQVWIDFPVLTESEYFFPVRFFSEKGKHDFKITFAKVHGQIKKTPDFKTLSEIQRDFPIKVGCYKTGTAINEKNSWHLFDEKWHKIQYW